MRKLKPYVALIDNSVFSSHLVIIMLLLIISLIRFTNLNYNSAFADEAIYIVLGKLGLFQWDWTSFAAGNWMAGSLFAYPPLTALAYTLGGIIGTRAINVLFGLATVVTVGKITALLITTSPKKPAVLLTLCLAGFSGISIFVSRLATYDMPAFYFFFLGCYYLLKAVKTDTFTGKWYFLSVFSLFVAAMFKVIILAYIPLVVCYAVLTLFSSHNQRRRFYFVRYYLVPAIICAVLYLALQGHGLYVYYLTHKGAETVAPQDIILGIWPYIKSSVVVWSVATLILFMLNHVRPALVFTFLSFWIIFLHLLAHREATLDKHVFLTANFIAIMAGVTLAFLNQRLSGVVARITKPALALSLVIFAFNGIQTGHAYGTTWDNTTALDTYLHSSVKTGDYLLSQEGPVTMLSIYQVNHPSLVGTFDWYAYQGHEGNEAYSRAVKDAHFNYIILFTDIDRTDDMHHQIQMLIDKSMDTSTYKIAYQDDTYSVYKRQYD